MGIVYVLIILAATLLGAICGFGGGVIIKPLLDAASDFSTFQISVISGFCILAMTITSITKSVIAKRKIDLRPAVLLSIGSILGGILGDYLFGLVESAAKGLYGNSADYLIKIAQNSLLFVLLTLTLIYMLFIQKKGLHFDVKNPLITVLVGLILGAISVFLDIGGPFNVCVFVLVFGMKVKEASICSLIAIFFSRMTKLAKWLIAGSFVKNPLFIGDLTIFIFLILILAAVLGGLIGSIINKKCSEKFVNIAYCCALGSVLVLNVYNIVTNALALAA